MTINLLPRKTWRQRILKGIHIVTMLALVLNISTVGILLQPKIASAAVQYTLEGQKKDTSFTTGNICGGGGSCYAEGENVPFRLTITGLTNGQTYTAKIQHDYKDSSGREGYVNFNTPGSWDANATAVSLSNAVTNGTPPNTISYDITFTAQAGTVKLKWFGLLGQSAGEWNGAQLHARLVQGVQQESIGNKEVPIQVNSIIIRTLKITKADDPDPINLNGTTTYTLVATNTGEQNETVTVTDTLPPQMTYVNGSASTTPTTVSGNVITWSGIALAKTSGTKTITFQAKGIESGTWTDTASVDATGLDPVTATEDTTVNQGPVTNPPLGQSCGLDIGLIVDTSGSVDSTEMTKMKTALTNFANAFTGTPTVFSLTSFATESVLERAFSRTPSQIANDISTDIPSDGTGSTNWDAGLGRSFGTFDPRETKSNLIVIATDGSPNRRGYPTLIDESQDYPAGLLAAIDRANLIKQAGTRIVVVGIGEDTADPATPAQKLEKMKSISGPNVALTPAEITVDTDVIKVTDFNGIGSALSAFANELCGGKILVQKQFDVDGDGTVDYDGSLPDTTLQGWTFDVNGSPSNPGAVTTTDTGALSFDVDNGTYSVVETNQKPGTHIVSASCVNGTEPAGTFNLETKTVSGLTMGTDETINCTFVNSVNTGSIRVNKNVDTNGDGDVDTVGATNWTWDIQGGDQNIATGSSRSVLSGTYTISEDQKANYHVTNLTCNNQSLGAVTSAEITVGNGETLCTFTNTRDTARVVLQKELVGNPQNHVPADWTFTVNGQQVNGNGGATTVLTNTDYPVTESSAYSSLYTLTNATGVCHLDQQGNIVLNATSTQGGTCTVTNTRNSGTLVVHKDVVNPDGGAVSDAHQFTVTLDGISPKTIAEGTDATYLNLPTGTYTVAENADGDYTFVSYSSDADANTAGAQVVVTKNQTTQLTVTNKQKQATITLNKDVRDYQGNDVADNTPFQVTWSGSPITISEGSPAVFHVNPGTYTFTETANSLYTTETASYQVTVSSNGSASHTFVNWQKPGTITGMKFNDVNGNGVKDQGDNGLQNWEIYLDSNNNGAWNSGEPKVTTDANGNYTFTNLTPGTYKVREVQKTGWTQTSPANNLNNVTLAVGQTVNNQDFGNFQLGTISGMKFNDLNGNSIKDVGEPGLANWTINISGPNSASTTTDVNGNYSFTNLTAGAYTVSETQQTGWMQTVPVGGDSHSVSITSGTNATGKDFGNFKYPVITVCKYVDVNGDGNIDGDPLYTAEGGWRVRVHGIPQYTDDGCATFTDIGPGSVQIDEEQKDGWVQTMPGNGVYFYTAVSGDEATFNFANFQIGSVSGTKWNDLNGNGTWDNDEPGLADWQITATKGQTVKNTTTDANGNYSFSFGADETGSWTIAEVQQTGWTQTSPVETTYNVNVQSGTVETGKNFGNFDNFDVFICKYVDANGDGSVAYDRFYDGEGGWPITLNDVTHYTENGCASFTDLGPGNYTLTEGSKDGWIQTYPEGGYQFDGQSGFDPEYIFANFELGSVSGRKFEDINGNGAYDSGIDAAKSGVTISLWKDGLEVDTDVTDVNGEYGFTGLTAGDYTVSENPLAGWVQTYPPLPGTYSFTITSGDHLIGYDFGNFKMTSISGMKFDDVNGNGIKEAGENGLPGWKIILSQWDDGSYSQIAATTTDDAGNYAFNNLQPGTYKVAEEQMNGWIQTHPDTNTYEGIELQSGVPVVGKDFGNFKLGRISGYKMDQSEHALNGWEICLSGGAIDGQTLTDFGVKCVTTGDGDWPDGYYEFTGLHAATYNLAETVQDGWAAVNPTSGTHTGIAVTSQFDQNYDFVNRKIYPDLTIAKTDGKTTANTGDSLTYTLTVKNEGEFRAENVSVTDTLPALVTFVSADNGGTYDSATRKVTWSLGTLTVNAMKELKVTVTVPAVMPFGTTVLTNGASVSTTTDEPNTGNNTATDTTSVTAAPTIGITKSASAAKVNPGSNVTFSMNWSIGANSQATNVVIVDSIPANTTFVSADNAGVYDATTNKVTWTLGTKNPGDHGTVSMIVKVANPLANGTIITNTATIDATEIDPPVSASASVTVTSGSILGITKLVDKQQVNPGSKLVYTVVVTNTGNDQATNVTVTDTLPTGFTFADTGLNAKTFTLGNLAAGASTSFTYEVNVASDATAGVKENLAKAKADNYSEVTAKAPVTVIIPQVLSEVALPELTIKKSVDKMFANPGDTVTYTVVVENVGDAAAVNAQLQDLLPAGFTFTDNTASKTFPLGTINAGEKKEVTYQVVIGKNVAKGTYDNFAVAWADNHGNVTTSVPLEVRIPQVLGETLPTTGSRLIEIAFLAFAILTVIFISWTLWVSREEEL